jgi:hypothetical protein
LLELASHVHALYLYVHFVSLYLSLVQLPLLSECRLRPSMGFES